MGKVKVRQYKHEICLSLHLVNILMQSSLLLTFCFLLFKVCCLEVHFHTFVCASRRRMKRHDTSLYSSHLPPSLLPRPCRHLAFVRCSNNLLPSRLSRTSSPPQSRRRSATSPILKYSPPHPHPQLHPHPRVVGKMRITRETGGRTAARTGSVPHDRAPRGASSSCLRDAAAP